ncbi:MAG: NifU family protein [SAR324 cluster bacterium]|nr:NifU family protein [SAR324 cluster bacterium]
MFKFKNLTGNEKSEEPKFNSDEFKVSYEEFLEKRRTATKSYVFDLRSSEDFEQSHLPGAHSLPIEHFENSIYQMPYEGDILIYGSNHGEARQAAELLYENGFDSFYFIEDYEELLQALADSKFTITDAALEEIKKRLQEAGSSLKGFRIIASAISPKIAKYSVDFVQESEDTAQDTIIKVGEIDVYLNQESLLYLQDTIVERESDAEHGLSIKNPNREVSPLTGSVKEAMEQLLEEQINPMVASHGGVIQLIDIEDGRVYLEFGGGCKGCGMVNVTLKQGVEVLVKEHIPGIVEVLDVTDHANGTNPYYQPGK